MTAKTQSRWGPLGHERLVIKGHKTTEAMNRFLNRSDNRHGLYVGPLPPGTYAFAGGEWRNVKSIKPSLLVHI